MLYLFKEANEILKILPRPVTVTFWAKITDIWGIKGYEPWIESWEKVYLSPKPMK